MQTPPSQEQILEKIYGFNAKIKLLSQKIVNKDQSIIFNELMIGIFNNNYSFTTYLTKKSLEDLQDILLDEYGVQLDEFDKKIQSYLQELIHDIYKENKTINELHACSEVDRLFSDNLYSLIQNQYETLPL